MYDTSKNPDEPELSLCFSRLYDNQDVGSPSVISVKRSPYSSSGSTPLRKSPNKRMAKSIFGPDLDDNEAVSFDIGKGNGWGPFTVYGLMKSGDIYSFCPVVPNRRYVMDTKF